MIASLSLGNFKCFKSLVLDLGGMNVFAGTNGAGKSTVIQSLLALRQSWQAASLSRDRLQLSGELVDLGTAGEVYCAEPNSDSIDITLASLAGDRVDLHCPQSQEHASDYFLQLVPPVSAGDLTIAGAGLFSDPFNYLHAERVGPRKVFQIASDEGHPLSVGKHGESAPFIVASPHRETAVANDYVILQSSDGREYPTLQYQWPLWMARLFPGFDAESEIYGRADQVRLGLALQRQQTGQSLFVRPTNTGFGLSFVLGIVVAGLVATPDTILIVENPEAHLHPKAQSALGEFLGRVSAGRTQVFVETHSEHILNGIRRMVKQRILRSDAVHVFFFTKESGAFEPSVTHIDLSPEGDVSAWPEGFFDQLDRDLSVILGQ